MGEFVLPPQNTLEVRNNLREEFSFIHADSADKCPTVELTREISFTISTARIKAPLAAPGKVRNKLPPLASNEFVGRRRPACTNVASQLNAETLRDLLDLSESRVEIVPTCIRFGLSQTLHEL